MRRFELVPVQTEHSNAVLSGKNFDDVMDLHITRVSHSDGVEAVLSVWKIPLWQRLKLLFDGRVNFMCWGKTHPPVSITIGDYFGT